MLCAGRTGEAVDGITTRTKGSLDPPAGSEFNQSTGLPVSVDCCGTGRRSELRAAPHFRRRPPPTADACRSRTLCAPGTWDVARTSDLSDRGKLRRRPGGSPDSTPELPPLRAQLPVYTCGT